MKIFSDTAQAFTATSPGSIVRLEMDARKIKLDRLARHLELKTYELEALLNGDAPLTPAIAAKLEELWGIEASTWTQLEQSYQRHPKHPKRGGARVGAGRKKSGIVSKQVRISASLDELKRIETWLKAQPSAAQSLAKLILEQTTKPAKRSKR
jgi:plasmid maintenance system antidote protein VapI